MQGKNTTQRTEEKEKLKEENLYGMKKCQLS